MEGVFNMDEKKKKVRLNINIPSELNDKLQTYADEIGLTKTAVIVMLLSQGVYGQNLVKELLTDKNVLETLTGKVEGVVNDID